MLGLLAKTKEYANFAQYALDSGESGVRCMDTNLDGKEPTLATKPKKAGAKASATSTKDFLEEEGDDWIPEEAYKVAHDFRNKVASKVSKALMNTLLSDLNKIWRAREKKQITRIKSEANREVQYLRREVAFKKPYDQVMHEQDIKRLKTELKDCQQALRENVAVIKQEQDGPNLGLNLVDKTVKYTNQIQIEKRELQLENERLNQKIAQLEAQSKTGDREREKFFEGATWSAK